VTLIRGLRAWISDLIWGRSCTDCVYRDGRWCGHRSLVELVLRHQLPPEASAIGRVLVQEAWVQCQGILHRRRP